MPNKILKKTMDIFDPLPKKSESTKSLQVIPGVGKSIAMNLYNLGIKSVSDLKGKNPELLYRQSNELAGTRQDPCLLYVFRCAVYYAESPVHDKKKLQWWYWKDGR